MTADDCVRATDVDLRQVRYVLALARELNYTRAAHSLHIAQQTLSSQVDALERRLGTRLFVRDRRRVELTAAGDIFVERGQQLLTLAADMVAATTSVAGPVRLDIITEGLVSGVLAGDLRTRLVDIPLEVVQGQGLTATLPALVTGAVDLAVGHVRGLLRPLPGGLDFMPVRLMEMGLLLPTDHPLARCGRVTMTELADWPLLVHTATEAPEWQRWNDQVIEAFSLRAGHRLHGHGRGAVAAAVMAFGEPSLAPLTAPTPDGTTVRPLVGPVPVCDLAVVWRTANAATPRVGRVLREITSIVTERRWLDFPSQPWWMPGPQVRANVLRAPAAPPSADE